MADLKAQDAATPATSQRRNFLIKLAATVIGGIAAVFPFAVGLFTFGDPLRRRAAAEGDGYIRVASLDALPDDGVPRQFAVIADRTDAWNRFPDEPIGAIYLRRKRGGKEIDAFNAICPHAGCFVAYAGERNVFQCPCHNSAFQLDGEIIQPSPSPRAMDKLECKIDKVDGREEILVKFQDFLPGRGEAIPKA
jgi:menaquinol-cytochrome c reductase iron-sulfur subunit